MWLSLLLGFICLLIYLKLVRVDNYWKRKGVPYLKPWPLIGNMESIIFQKTQVSDIIQNFYDSFPNARYVGLHQFRKPTLLIRDPELIRQITTKHFQNFPEHSLFNNDENDVLKNKGLFSLGAKSGWLRMRKKLNPGFFPTRMKEMFLMINENVDLFLEYLQKQESTKIDTKQAFSLLNCNILASTMFGTTISCFQEPIHKLLFMANQINDFSGFKFIRIFATTISMTLTKFFCIELARAEVFIYFMEFIKKSLSDRQECRTYRPDMINFMLDTKTQDTGTDDENVQENLSLDEIAMQLFGFFIGGYDAISALLSYATYELAVNPKIQEKVRSEIEDMTKHELTYETLMKMKYLDMVVLEVLRKWPIAVFVDRKCTQTFKIEPQLPDEQELILEPGIICWIPIYAIHRNPKYYPDPEKFDPNRFNEKDKQIKRSVYLPFGSGPRTCIASKFSVYVCKLVLVRILQRYQILECEETQPPSDVSKIVIFLSGSGCKVIFKRQ